MVGFLKPGRFVAIVLAAILTAAAAPSALSQSAGGLWEMTRDAAPGRVRQCVANPHILAQFEHRAQQCQHSVISDSGTELIIEYKCAGSGFGRSRVTVLTPRSLRIETQGISGGLPFNYVVQARRVGSC